MLPDARIEFILEPPPNRPAWRPFVVPHVNGRDLRDLVGSLEEWGEDVAASVVASFGGIPAVNPEQLHRQFWGHARGLPRGLVEYEFSITVLGCSCGIVDCWPLEVTLEVDEQLVTWASFRHPSRTVSFESPGPFRFDRVEYESGLKHIEQSLARDRIPGWV